MSALTHVRTHLDHVEDAIEQLRLGRPVVLTDDDRDGDGDLICPADSATPELIAFMVRHTSGFLRVALQESDADRLALPLMCQVNNGKSGCEYTVSVDARTGVSTGISARDRCRTIRLLADPRTEADDLSRPGHVMALRAKPGGVLSRGGHTEAAVDLARLAGRQPAGVLGAVVSVQRPTEMARGPELREFCDTHGLAMISIDSLIAYRRRREPIIARRAQARLPLPQGTFTAIGYQTGIDAREHLALVYGDIRSGQDVLVRVQSECLLADAFGATGCGCRAELEASLSAVAREGRGVVVYLRSHEGRDAGLLAAITHLAATQDAGRLGSITPLADHRDRAVSAHILADLGVQSTRGPSLVAGDRQAHGYGLAQFGPELLAR